MLRRLFSLGALFLAVSATPSFALKAGLQAGLNVANADYSSPVAVNRSDNKFVGGVLVELPLVPMLSLQPELLYRQWANDWVTVPVLAKLRLEVTPVFKPVLLVGPEFAFRLSNTLYKSMDFGIDAGAGAEFEIFTGVSVLVNVRYVLGLSDINNDPVVPGSIKTRNVYVMAGVTWEI